MDGNGADGIVDLEFLVYENDGEDHQNAVKVR
jgi:hypothetical protein